MFGSVTKAAAWSVAALLALYGSAQAYPDHANHGGKNGGSSGHHSARQGNNHKNHHVDKSHHESRHSEKGRHGSKSSKDGKSKYRKGNKDHGGHGDHAHRDSHHGKDGNRGRHAHERPRRLRGIGERNEKYFDSKLVARHNGDRHYLEDRVVDKHYHERCGREFRYYCGNRECHGYCYPGRYHRHWNYCCWNPHYRHWFFYDGCTRGFFYYCHSHDCYLPVDCGCSTCLSTPDDELVPPCDEDDDECCACEDDDECSCCDVDEDECDCGECSCHKRIIVEIEDDE